MNITDGAAMTLGNRMQPFEKRLDFSHWYDNEWGYSNRCVDLAIFIGNKMKDLGKQASQKTAVKT